MKRQRGRGRGGGGGSGGKPQQQNANRAFDSNGPEGVKVRGNAQTVFEKYQQLARDATSGGDRVLAENYLQHAEHYFRLLRALQPQRPASEILGRDQFQSGYDIDFEDEGVQAQHEAADEAAAEASLNEGDGEARDGRWQARDDRPPREDRPRDDRPRDDRNRDRFESRDRDERPREDRNRDERSRDDRNRGDGQAAQSQGQGGQGRRDRWRDRDDRPRDDRPRDDRPRDDRPRGERNAGERNGEERRDRRDEPRESAPLIEAPPPAPAPFVEERPAQVLRDADGGESHAPAFLQAPAAAPRPEAGDEAAPVRKPRRRRAPRTFEGGDGSTNSSETEGA